MHYILIFIPTESIKIIGPFMTTTAAGDFGREWEMENKSPFWQVIDKPSVEFIPAEEK